MKILKEKKLLQYAAVFILTAFCYTMFRLIAPSTTAGVKAAMGTLVLFAGINILCSLKTKQLTPESLVTTVILAGIVMRIGYMLYTPCDVRSHDLWDFNTEDCGHAGYILTILQDKMLPQTNTRQYYQQPFFYILGALVSAPVNAFLGSSDPYQLVDTVKIISCSASCMTLLLSRSVCDELELKGWWRAAAITFTAFHPAFYLSEGITPDMLSTLLMTIALVYTLRWEKTPDWKNTVILAFTYGFAVMTKLSATAAAVFTAFIFLLKFTELMKEKKAGTIVPKLLVFIAVSFPMGLWYSIRNYRKFAQPFVYIDVPGDISLDTSEHSYFSRLLLPDLKNLFTEVYTNVCSDYSIWTYMIKSSVFGEFSFSIYSVIPGILLMAAVALTVPVLAGIISGAAKYRKKDTQFFTAIAVLVFMASILFFYYKYPYGCSMDFRYMTFMVIPAAALAGKYCSEKHGSKTGTLYASALGVYSVFSCLMYTMLQ